MAHGLVLKLEEMVQNSRKNSISTNLKGSVPLHSQDSDMFSDENLVIQSWFIASKKYSRLEFLNLLRKTLLYMLSPQWKKGKRSHDIVKEFRIYCHKFHVAIKNCKEICRAVLSLSASPWQNGFFVWDDLFKKKLSIEDKKVQEYFSTEPEEIVSARVHFLLLSKNEDKALTLAELSFLYHSRIAKDMKNEVSQNKSGVGFPSLDWYLFILQRKKSLSAIINKVKQLNCDEGLLLISKLRRNPKSKHFAHTLLQIFLVRDLIQSSKYCCTKKLFTLWCIRHKEMNSGLKEIADAAQKIFAGNAPTSAHFYVLVDSLWEQFGTKFISLYVELYIRGLTIDINYLEAAKNSDVPEDVEYLETHIASVFTKLSTLFANYHNAAARECMFSAFSLRPTKKRLCILQSLDLNILSNKEENLTLCSMDKQSMSFKECKCSIKCNGSCKSIKSRSNFTHPLLNRGISNIPFMLVKDLVCILECVRCFNFQYNIFDWRSNFTELSEYQKYFNRNNFKDIDSDTELTSDVSIKSDYENDQTLPNYSVAKVNFEPVYSSVKRKSQCDNTNEMFSLDIGANIEVKSDESVNKKFKFLEQEVKNQRKLYHHSFNQNILCQQSPKQMVNNGMQMQDAIENVIRMTLGDRVSEAKPTCSSKHLEKALNYSGNGVSNLTSIDEKATADHNTHPFTFTPSINQQNQSQPRAYYENNSQLLKSNVEGDKMSHYNSQGDFTVCTSSSKYTSRDSVVVSSNVESKEGKGIFTTEMEHQNSNSISKSVVKTISLPLSNQLRGIDSISNLHTGVAAYEHGALNLSCSNTYEQSNVKNAFNCDSSPVFRANAGSGLSCEKLGSGVSAFQSNPNPSYYQNASYVSSSNRHINDQAKPAHQSLNYLKDTQTNFNSSHTKQHQAHDFVFNSERKTDQETSRQGMTFFDAEKQIQHDRNSVIQHTMQHTDKGMQMPSHLSVSFNSRVVQQIRNNAKKEVGNLQPFTVNVSDKAIPKLRFPVKANLVIDRKPHHTAPTASVQSTVPNTISSLGKRDTITVPGILASPSVIMNPAWEAYRKSHGDVLCKKNTNSTSTSGIKKVYRKPLLTQSSVILKAQNDKLQNKIPTENLVSEDQMSKIQLSASQNNFSNASHHWPSVSNPNSIASTIKSAVVTTSQPWYTVPYSALSADKKSVANSVHTNINAGKTSMLPIDSHEQQHIHVSDSNANSFSSLTSSLDSTSHLLARNTSLPSPTYRLSHFNSDSSSKTVVYTSASTSSAQFKNICVIQKKQLLNNVSQNASNVSCISPSLSSSSASTNINTYTSVESDGIRNISNSPSDHYIHRTPDVSKILVEDKRSPVVFSATQTFPISQYSHSPNISEDIFTTACCSPMETNPCQSCSLTNKTSATYADPKVQTQSSSVKSGSSNKISQEPASSINDFKNLGNSNMQPYSLFHYPEEKKVICQFCSFSCHPSELESHMASFHDEKASVMFSEDKTNMKLMPPEVSLEAVKPAAKQSVDVMPEQSALHQIPETGVIQNSSFEYAMEKSNNFFLEDEENSKSIEENPFSVCMDIINSENDFKEIVQGVSSFEHIESYSVPSIPCANESFTFSNHTSFPVVSQESDILPQDYNFANFSEDEYDRSFSAKSPSVENITKDESLLYTDKDFEDVFNFTDKEKEYEDLRKMPYNRDMQNVKRYQLSPLSVVDETRMIPFPNSDSSKLVQKYEGEFANKMKESKISSPLIFFNCRFCKRKLRSAAALKRHEIKFHQNYPRNEESPITQMQYADFSGSECIGNGREISKPNSNFHSSNINANKKCNSMENLGAEKTVFDLDTSEIIYKSTPGTKINTDFTTAVNVENGNAVIKYKGKNIVKGPLSQCKYCGKMLTSVYIKKHVLKKHNNVLIKNENLALNLNVGITPEVSAFPHQYESHTALTDANSSTSMSGAVNMFKTLNSSNINFIPPVDSDKNLCLENVPKRAMHLPEYVDRNPLHLNNSSKSSDIVFENNEEKEKTVLPVTSESNRCYICNKSYCTVTYLKKHMKTVHGSNSLEINQWVKRKKCKVSKLGSMSLVTNTENNPSLGAGANICSILQKNESPENMTNKESVISDENQNLAREALTLPALKTEFFSEADPESSSLNMDSMLENNCGLNVKNVSIEKGDSENNSANNMINICASPDIKFPFNNKHETSIKEKGNLCAMENNFWSKSPTLSLTVLEPATDSNLCVEPNDFFSNYTENINFKCSNVTETKTLNSRASVTHIKEVTPCSVVIRDSSHENQNSLICDNERSLVRDTYFKENVNSYIEQLTEVKASNKLNFDNLKCKEFNSDNCDPENAISKEAIDKNISPKFMVGTKECLSDLGDEMVRKSQIMNSSTKLLTKSALNKLEDSNSVKETSYVYSENCNSEVSFTDDDQSSYSSFFNSRCVAAEVSKACISSVESKSPVDKTVPILKLSKISKVYTSDSAGQDILEKDKELLADVTSNLVASAWQCVSNPEFGTDESSLSTDLLQKQQCDTVENNNAESVERISPVFVEQKKSDVDVPNFISDHSVTDLELSESETIKQCNSEEQKGKHSFNSNLCANIFQKKRLSRSFGDSRKLAHVCRLCNKKFNSMSALSKHLKSIHDVPLLKKQCSFADTRPKLYDSNLETPPNLSLFPSCDSDSASASTEVDLKSWYCKTEDIKKTKSMKMSESCKNTQNSWKQSFNKVQLSINVDPKSEDFTKEKEIGNVESIAHIENSSFAMLKDQDFDKTMQSKNEVIYNGKCRRHSFCDAELSRKSYKTDGRPTSIKTQYLHSKDSSMIQPQGSMQENYSCADSLLKHCCIKLRRNSLSSFDLETRNISPLQLSNIEVMAGKAILNQNASNEHDSFSTKTCYTNMLQTTSSPTCVDFENIHSYSKITCSKNNLKSSSLLNCVPHADQTETVHSEASSLSLQNCLKHKVLKSRKNIRQVHKKRKETQKLNYFALTLEKGKDIAEFLEKHGQPVVKLTRLKNTELTMSKHLNPKMEALNCKTLKGFLKQPVVKLKRLDVPNNISLACQKKLTPEELPDINVQNIIEKNSGGFQLTSEDALCAADSVMVSLPESPTMQENSIKHKPKLSIIVRRLNSGLNPDYAISHASCDESPKENFIDINKNINFNSIKYCNLPLMKKCYVLVEKLAV